MIEIALSLFIFYVSSPAYIALKKLYSFFPLISTFTTYSANAPESTLGSQSLAKKVAEIYFRATLYFRQK